MRNKKILGVRFDDFQNKDEFLSRILHEFEDAKTSKRSKLISYLNVHCLNLAHTDRKFKQVLNNADVLFFDSMGLKIVANLFMRLKISFASTPPEWMHEFFDWLPQGTKLFFIGDEPEVIRQYNQVFQELFPTLKAVGYHNGFFLDDPEVEDSLIDQVREANPDIVIVGMGMPIQEFWIEEIKNKLQVPMFMPVGAYYQRMLGTQKRPLPIVSKIGMEWLFRFAMDPKRLFRRYFIGNPLFILRILKYEFKVIKRS